MSQWGLWSDDIDPIDLGFLLTAYVKRTRFESRVRAVELVKAFGEAYKSGDGHNSTIPPESMIAMLGGFS